MPVLKHAKKKLKQDKKRTLANKKTRSTFKELVKKAKAAPTKESVSAAFKAIDKGAKANLMHDNKAARMKSSLTKILDGKVKPQPTAKKKVVAVSKKTSPKALKKAAAKKTSK